MNASSEFATAERELAMAQSSFNTARRALDTTLSMLGAREGTTDRIVHHADEYGVDHTLSVLNKTPDVFDLEENIPEKEKPAIHTQLQTAYETMHAVDLAMAKVENLARKTNPSREKAILIGSSLYVFNSKTDTLHNRDNGETVRADARTVGTEEDGGPQRKTEQDRDR